MAKMTKENLKEMKESELKSKLDGLRESLRVLRFKAEGSKSKDIKETNKIKKEIARVLTKINQKNVLK